MMPKVWFRGAFVIGTMHKTDFNERSSVIPWTGEMPDLEVSQRSF